MRKTHLLFLIILIEGYVVLAAELLAIRQLIPFVGSGTEIIAIIISGVLLPLAVGYQHGGRAFKKNYASAKTGHRTALSIRRILLRNLATAMVFLSFGTSSMFLDVFFQSLYRAGVNNRLLQTAIFTVLFLVVPLFKLGQTVPLASNYFSRRQMSEITGKMLFFSTLGSFLGSVFSTIVLMSTIGVHNTVIVTIGLLVLLCLLLNGRRTLWLFCVSAFVAVVLTLITKVPAVAIIAIGLCGLVDVLFVGKKRRRETGLCAVVFMVFALVCIMNSDATMKVLNVVADNSYNQIRVLRLPEEDSTILEINRSMSSKLAADPEKRFEYMRFVQDNFIKPITAPGNQPRDILAIGAGGFSLAQDDAVNAYTFVDIDRTMKDVVEKDVLGHAMGPNIKFVPDSAREFVHQDTHRYDLIFIDAYTNIHSLPMECTTREFLQEVKARLKPDGIVVANVVSSPFFADKFSVRYAHTFASVFPTYSRQIIGPFNAWNGDRAEPEDNRNTLYIYFNTKNAGDDAIYTDDKNTYSLDRGGK